MIKKIISGGQVGADQAALDVAIKMGISHGGYIQKGRKTQSGLLPEKYKLKEMPTASFIKRIEQNVINSDGTLVISHGELSGGAGYCKKMADKHGRPCIHIDLSQTPILIAASSIHTWLKANNIEVLNVTGSRASEDPEIYKETMLIVENTLLLGLGKTESGEYSIDYGNKKKLDKLQSLPKTVTEAIDQIIAGLSLQDRVKIAHLKKKDLKQTHFSLGFYIKDQWLRKDAKGELFKACRKISGKDHLNENGAVFVIIEKLWENLRKTHRLRIIK
ncbi:MAG: putative molybdenum carrier protein [Desulfobacterales bacterium]|nr:MAG: putative molybdenum carrier protein [Desulfobacterales bacterium]UCD90370.1 MAG: putative molybdenum carrier protein [Desulfobacterales bacterium]